MGGQSLMRSIVWLRLCLLFYEPLPEYPVPCMGMNGSEGLGDKFVQYKLVFHF